MRRRRIGLTVLLLSASCLLAVWIVLRVHPRRDSAPGASAPTPAPGDLTERARAESLDAAIALSETKGDYAEALKLAEVQGEILRRRLGAVHLEVAENLDRQAEYLLNQGDYLQAETRYLAAEAMLLETVGPDHPEMARHWEGQGRLLRLRHEYAAAEELFHKAQDLCSATLGENCELFLQILCSRAANLRYLDLEGKQDPLPLYGQAQALARSLDGAESLSMAQVEHSFGVFQFMQHRYPEAERLLRSALETRQKLLAPDHPMIAWNLHDLADLLLKKQDYAGAEGLYRSSLEKRRKRLGPRYPLIVEDLRWLSHCAQARGAYAEAEALSAEAAQAFEEIRLRAGIDYARATFLISPYDVLALNRIMLGKWNDAWSATELTHGRTLAEMLLASGQRALTPSELAREAALRDSLARLERALAALASLPPESKTDERASERRRLGIDLLRTEKAWTEFQGQMTVRYPMSNGAAFSLGRVQASLDDSTAIVGWLAASLLRKGAVYWAYVVRNHGNVRWERLSGGDGSPESGRGSGDGVAESCLAFRDALREAARWPMRLEETGAINQHAQALFQKCLAPLLPHLRGVRRIVFVPSPPVTGLPLEVLRDPGGEYLCDRFAISYAPSATLYTWLRERRRESAPRRAMSGGDGSDYRALLVGDPPMNEEQMAAMDAESVSLDARPVDSLLISSPILDETLMRSVLSGDRSAIARLPRLRWSRREVVQLASLFGGSTCLLGSQASEQGLARLIEEKRLSGYDHIHFATHAFVDHLRPERSALVLSQVTREAAQSDPERAYDGLLTMKEIMRDVSIDAQLVTLSGCQTGLGRESAGEGTIGLAQAFLHAGAHSVLVSLWRVDDRATAVLMGRFYEDLALRDRLPIEGTAGGPMTEAEALGEAKTWLRKYADPDGKKRFQHPISWAGFVLMGDAN